MAGFGKRREHVREEEQVDELTGFSTVQVTVGFCVLGLLGALFLTPILDSGAQRLAGAAESLSPGGFDRTVTGSINKPSRTKRYTIRRSVMQKDPSVPCIIYEDGTREGGC